MTQTQPGNLSWADKVLSYLLCKGYNNTQHNSPALRLHQTVHFAEEYGYSLETKGLPTFSN
ncbi:hypothetical protein PGT21_016803 [Puccinia graminis f. sp. tritici]|uniref:Uncharacterized protein n=1 Tax=Puccinia graminis f. sp. tritici TaxID=56615 RepID=A0A5B0MNY4_PUCGR|nr:hypothetical protein PGT21_016803 [Puccinia graminis f. sp. tritici]